MTLYDRVRAVTGTTGTGSVVMGAAVSGYRDFTVCANGATVPYCIEDGNAWEIGEGVWTSLTNTLTRSFSSSSTGSLLSLTGRASAFISPTAASLNGVDALGTMANQNATSVAITGGTAVGLTSLGVGTSSPANRLTVDADANASTTPLSVRNVSTAVKAEVALNGNGDASLSLYASPSTKTILLDAGGDSYLNVSKVGIGTTSPATKLDVDGPARVKSYTVGTVPAAASIAGAHIFVTNEAGGATGAQSDGTNWRRYSDRAIIS